jgi:hypothetical protein
MTLEREIIQHIDVEIPVIEISEGWSAASVQTMDECNNAFSYLMSAVAQIEFQIDTELTKPKNFQDVYWLARAKCALKYKKAALQIVQQRRGVIAEADKRMWQERRDACLLEHIRSVTPDRQFLEWIKASGTERVGRNYAEEDQEQAA